MGGEMINFYVLIMFNTKMPHLGNNTDPEWIDYRLDIFQHYTLKSLINQKKRLKIWMLCCEESKEYIESRMESIRAKNKDMRKVEFIYDCKVACDKIENSNKPLWFLKIDSDDMYRRGTIRICKKSLRCAKEISLLMFRNGFIYDLKTGDLSLFERWSICTYATYYPRGHFSYENLAKYCLCDQTKVYERFIPKINTDNMVCCLDHDMNLHRDPRRESMETEKRTGQKGLLLKEETSTILRRFGLR